ncbi:hypothetical protein [Enterococcus mundtii]|uniref:hypothetical protein n=1 Tax=Enterococcus mundtii TaxID=53346 RepID=UPI00055929C2|nr:hypothetical protein [Enterococcus mundtii]
MSFWISITERVDLYVIEQNGELLEAILRDFFPYLKKSAKNAQISAEKLGVYIPFEDFYSTYLLATWKAIEDYRLERKKKELKFKNLFLYRLAIAEKDVWRLYKKVQTIRMTKMGLLMMLGVGNL